MAVNLFDKYLKEGYSIAVDADCADSDVQKIINNFTQKYNLITTWIHIKTPEQEILKRLQPDNTERQFIGEEALKSYHRRKGLHDDLSNMNFTYVFNESTSDLNVQIPEAVEEIKNNLQKII